MSRATTEKETAPPESTYLLIARVLCRRLKRTHGREEKKKVVGDIVDSLKKLLAQGGPR